MPYPLDLPHGDHAITQPAVSWRVQVVGTNPPGVELIASIQSDPQTSVPTRGEAATTVAIHMDARAATNLYSRLTELGRKMGWLQQAKQVVQTQRRNP
jgi:hypothetical protein